MERGKSLNFNSSSTYPLHQSNELCFQQPNYPTTKKDHKKQGHEGNSNDTGATTSKKITHRNVERQRRQEMATRYELLRSLLPIEYLKGKRSISDHMNQAAYYIKHLETKNKELNEKRDKLRKLVNSRTLDGVTRGSCSSDSVIVRPCWAGVEVVISTSLRDGEVPLSRLLGVLVEGGLDVVNCVSTQSNNMLIHSMQSKVSNPATVDMSGLQEKLMFVVESASRIT